MAAAMITSTTFVLATGNWGALRCDRRSLLYFAGAGACENTGVLLFLMALGLGEVSVVTPLAGVAPLFVLLLALLFPGAAGKVGWRVVVGAVLIVKGVCLLSGLRSRSLKGTAFATDQGRTTLSPTIAVHSS